MATTWAGTSSNQGITRTAMNDFWAQNTSGNNPWCSGCTLPANSLQLITKQYLADNYVYTASFGIYLINTAKSSLQILVKSDIGIKIDLYTTTGACDFGTFVATVYLNSTLGLAYTNAAQTTLYNGGGTERTTEDILMGGGQYTRLTISSVGVVTGIIGDFC